MDDVMISLFIIGLAGGAAFILLCRANFWEFAVWFAAAAGLCAIGHAFTDVQQSLVALGGLSTRPPFHLMQF